MPNLRQEGGEVGDREEWIAFCIDYNAAVLKAERHTMAWCRECQEVGHPYHDGLHWGL